MEYHSAIKIKEIMPFVTVWMDLEGIMLSEASHTQKDKYYVILFICRIFKKKQTHRNRRLLVAGTSG